MSNKAKGNAKTGAALNSEKVLGTDKIMTLDSTGYVDIPENADLNNDKYKQFGAYACPLTVRARTLLNCPTQVAFRMHVIPGTGIGSAYPMQIISPMDVGIEFRRTWLNDGKVWGSWRETAQTETVELTLLNGWKSASGYLVHTSRAGNLVTINIIAEDGATTENTVLTSLPSGFRPKHAQRLICQSGTNFAESTVGTVDVKTNGSVVLNFTFKKALTLSASFSL